MPLWRDNILPLLFILPENKKTAMGAQENFGCSRTGHTSRAEQMDVRLVESGERFVLVSN